MSIKFLIRILNFYIILSCITCQRFHWLDDFIKSLQNDQREYQLLLLSDPIQRYKSLTTEKIITKFSQNVNVLQVSYEEINSQVAQNLSRQPEFSNPRTIMHVIILSEKNENFQEIIGILSEISDAKQRGRFLLISVEEQGNDVVRNILKFMWSKKILDATLVECVESPVNENQLKSFFHRQKSNESNELNESSAIIHQYNPFSKIYQTSNFTNSDFMRKIIWFPHKDRNLHQYTMKVGLLKSPPYIMFTDNVNGTIPRPAGTIIEIAKFIGREINYKIVWKTSYPVSAFGRINCQKEKSTGIMKLLLFSEINYFPIETTYVQFCQKQMTEWTKGGSSMVNIGILVPIHTDKSHLVMMYGQIASACIIGVFFLFTWELFRSVSLDRSNLTLLDLLAIVLSMSSLVQPRRSVERVFFAFILIGCFVYSSDFLTMLTNFSLKKFDKRELNTIEDVVASNLRAITNKAYFLKMEAFRTGHLRHLGEKVSIYQGSNEECFQQVFTRKNVACIQKTEYLRTRLQKAMAQCGEVNAKLINERVASNPLTTLLEPASPFLEMYERYKQRLFESGFYDELLKKYAITIPDHKKTLTVPCDSGGSGTSGSWQILTFVVIGYFLSLILFFAELIYTYCKK